MPTTTLNTYEGSDIISHLYHTANKTQEQTVPNEAVGWYVQTLSAIRRDQENNTELLGLILFNLGKAIAYDHCNNSVAIACCEASTDINKRAGLSEYHTDCIYMAASVVEILEDLPAAIRMYQRALDRYRVRGHENKARIVQDILRSMMHRLGERKYRQIKFETSPMQPYRFLIRYNGMTLHRLTISRDGWVEWKDYIDVMPELSTASAAGWEIVCDNC